MKAKALLILLLLAPSCSAYFAVDFASHVDGVVRADNFSINVSIKNRGDEVGYETVLELLMPAEFVTQTQYVGEIMPNQTKDVIFQVAATPTALPGTYQMPVHLVLVNINQDYISMIHPVIVNYKQKTISKILIDAQDLAVRVDEAKAYPITLFNNGDNLKKPRLRLVTPQSIRVTELPSIASIQAKTQHEITPQIDASLAFPNANFVAIISAEYEENGAHYQTSQIKTITTLEKSPQIPPYKNPLLLLAGFIILSYLLFMQRDKIIRSLKR